MPEEKTKPHNSPAAVDFRTSAIILSLSAVFIAASARGLWRLASLIPLLLILPAYYIYCLKRLRELSAAGIAETADFILGPGAMLVGALQLRAEILPFLKTCCPVPPSTVAEIGRAKGGTLALLCRAAAPDALVISLDLPGAIHSGPVPIFNKGAWRRPLLRAMAGPAQDLRLIDADSKSALAVKLFGEALGGRKLDLLFIDGDHTWAGVKSDFELYSGFVKPGGIIAFHDINSGLEEFGVAVSRFWRETALPGARMEFIASASQVSYGIGALRLPL